MVGYHHLLKYIFITVVVEDDDYHYIDVFCFFNDLCKIHGNTSLDVFFCVSICLTFLLSEDMFTAGAAALAPPAGR